MEYPAACQPAHNHPCQEQADRLGSPGARQVQLGLQEIGAPEDHAELHCHSQHQREPVKPEAQGQAVACLPGGRVPPFYPARLQQQEAKQQGKRGGKNQRQPPADHQTGKPAHQQRRRGGCQRGEHVCLRDGNRPQLAVFL